MSKTRIDRLGHRLREGVPTESDLRELSEYRETFAPAYRSVLAVVRESLGVEPTGRPAKSTGAIVDKLRRESIRLSQIQDIAGLRLVVPDVPTQDATVEQLTAAFSKTMVVDRRDRPSHGYRAVHVIVVFEGMPVEIQVRTVLQHRWAELSEKLSDLIDRSIKYGGGESEVAEALLVASDAVAKIEDAERSQTEVEDAFRKAGTPAVWKEEVDMNRRTLNRVLAEAHAAFETVMRQVRLLSEER